ncbi:MAG: ComF family protein [Clostridia bacterium]
MYPPVCAFCGKLDENFLCENCRKELKKIEKAHINKYNAKNIYYDEHIYLFKYEDYIRKQIISYKFDDKPYYYKTFVKVLLNNKKICEILKSYDIIISVPMHNSRRKERGYNQTELIAKEITKELKEEKKKKQDKQHYYNAQNNINNLKYINLLIKNKNTVPQSTLNKKQRLENSRNVYGIKDIEETKIITQKNILIFDDIYTTGSTANECARIIRQFNPKKIGILTIAKD